ncbi:MAG: hypothetical protein JXR14_06200 [Paracoccaceae bacterium]
MAEVKLSFEDLMPADLAGRSYPACGVTLSARNKFVRNTASGGVIRFSFDVPSKVGDLVLINCTAGGMVWVFDPQEDIIETVGIPAAPYDTTTTVRFGLPGISRLEVRFAGEGAVDGLSFEVDDRVVAASSDCKPGRQRGNAARLKPVSSDPASARMPQALARPRAALNLVYDVNDETVGGSRGHE